MRALSIVLGLAVSSSALAICPLTDATVGLGAAAAAGDTTGAVNDWFPTCGASNADDVAYEFTAPAAGTYEFELQGSAYDTVLAAISTADCATELACNDDFYGLRSSVTLTLAAGETIVLVVDGFLSSTGAYVLNTYALGTCGNGVLEGAEECDDGNLTDGDGCEADCTFSPVCGDGILEGLEECDDGNLANGDGCESNCTITPGVCAADGNLGSVVGAGVAIGNTCGAVNDADGATCGGGQGSEDFYFDWTAPTTGFYSINTEGLTNYDSALTVRDLSCTELYCDDDGGTGLLSNISAVFTGGTTYRIAVDGFGGGQCGDFSLNIEQPFFLMANDPVAGQSMTFMAYNAPAGANVYFLVSPREDATNPLCHPVVTSACTTLQRPVVLGNTRADASGYAELTVTVPGSVTPGFLVYSQAFWLQQGNGAVSNLNFNFAP